MKALKKWIKIFKDTNKVHTPFWMLNIITISLFILSGLLNFFINKNYFVATCNGLAAFGFFMLMYAQGKAWREEFKKTKKNNEDYENLKILNDLKRKREDRADFFHQKEKNS